MLTSLENWSPPLPEHGFFRPARLFITTVLLACISVGLFARIKYIETDHFYFDSIARYIPLAQNLCEHHVLSLSDSRPYIPDGFNQPLYPAFLAVLIRAIGKHWRLICAVQLGLEILLLIAAGYSGKRFGLWPMMVIAVGLLYPFSFHYFDSVLSEALATMLIAAMLWFLLNERWVLAGFSGGLSILTRSDLLIAVVLMALALLFRKRSGFRSAVLVGASVLVVLAPWSARNFKEFGNLSPLGGVASQVDDPYAEWMDDWADSPSYLETYWLPEIPDRPTTLPQIVPEPARRSAESALRLAKARGSMEGAPNGVFRQLAVSARPSLVKSIWIRARRTVICFFRPTAQPVRGGWKGTSLESLFMITVMAGVWLLRRDRNAWLLIALVAGRAALPFISIVGAQPRLMVEALPAEFIFASALISKLLMRWRWSREMLSDAEPSFVND